MTRIRLNASRGPLERRSHVGRRTLLRYSPLSLSAISANPCRRRSRGACRGRDRYRAALEEIVVTAQKKAENLQDVPISISVLETRNSRSCTSPNLDDYVKYSPSISSCAAKVRAATVSRARRTSICAASSAAARQPLGVAAERRHVPR